MSANGLRPDPVFPPSRCSSLSRIEDAPGPKPIKEIKMSAVRWVVGRWARIDLVDDVVDPICRKPRNIDDAGFQRGAVDLVENGPKALFSRHIGLDLGANEKARSRRPYVTGAVADGLIRLVQMTAGDQSDRMAPHQL